MTSGDSAKKLKKKANEHLILSLHVACLDGGEMMDSEGSRVELAKNKLILSKK